MPQLSRRSCPNAALRATLAALFCAAAITASGCGSDSTEEGDGGGGAFTRIYNSSQFQRCAGCHAPGAPGNVAGIEKTQDWSTREKAYASLKRTASGLTANFANCNGKPLVGSSPANSLLVASLDEDVRESFEVEACTGDDISDMTLKIGGPLPASLLAELKAWIAAGAPND